MKNNWKIINNLRGKPKKRSEINSIISDGVEITDADKLSEIFKNHYTVQNDQKFPKLLAESSQTNQSLFLYPTTPQEVFLTICSLKNNCSNQQTDIPVRTLKLVADIVSLPLCDIINNSFVAGAFVLSLKIGKIVPKFKKR